MRSRWESLNPAPTRRIPILIGGQGERKTLRLVARHADIWHTFTGLDEMPRKIGIFHEWCAEEGRDPAEIELSTGFTIRGFGPLLEEDAPSRLHALGFRLLIPAIDGPDYDLSAVARSPMRGAPDGATANLHTASPGGRRSHACRVAFGRRREGG